MFGSNISHYMACAFTFLDSFTFGFDESNNTIMHFPCKFVFDGAWLYV